MACYLTASRYYLNQCSFTINEILWHSFQSNFYFNTEDTNPKVVLEICIHIWNHSHTSQGTMSWCICQMFHRVYHVRWLSWYFLCIVPRLSHKICTVAFCCSCIIISWFAGFFFLPISFRVTSLALRQSYDCLSASEVTLKDMGKIRHLTKTKHKSCAYFLDFFYMTCMYMCINVCCNWFRPKKP